MQVPKEQVIATIIAVIIILLFLGVLFVLMLIYYRSRKKQMAKEKENLQLVFLQQLAVTKLETQEQTMRHLSNELHDNIGQLLGSVKMFLSIAQRKKANDAEALQSADDTLGQAIAELRSLSKTMHTEWLEQFDFIQNLTTEANRMNTAKKHSVRLSHNIEKIPLSNDKQVVLFRIVQEAVNNACKHGQASNIEIDTKQINDRIQLTIIDNGPGFNEKELPSGIGMMNMKQRTELLKGKIDWKSNDKGTTVMIQIPVNA
jgi:signal transduction histidine kinase